jgi:predicted metal-dependent hydrolase
LNITQDALIVADLRIPLRVQAGRNRKLQMRFDRECLLVETSTGQLGTHEIHFLQNNLKWITTHYHKVKKSWDHKLQFLKSIESKTMILGKEAEVTFLESPSYRYRYEAGALVIYAPDSAFRRKKELIASVLRKIATDYLQKAISHWLETTGLSIHRLLIKNHYSKWGSCSSLKNINLNWHLIMLDKSLIDYVIVHELMHLHEMNHSDRFWKHVEQWYPQHKNARQKMKQQQWIIGIYDSTQ